ncbi:DEAD/DEAH box helicase [Feifania hominis]|uniref:ATP-dependent RNA helicase CshA n=1 Tax=Feifania hominis TaxID=2763660 RepID=A0A926DD04_9FIRM|nr:DEAD/DEAH box helicase [Feifania hominis]MBC8535858.1 DEAD/DEAH box helicase [Feifania hominis]
MNFTDLNLIPELMHAISDMGYEMPSPIQEKAITPVLAGYDLVGCAQTGTGKTAAFALPILQQLSTREAQGVRPIRALILTPTRELALQIEESFEALGKYLPLCEAVLFGGVGQQPQVDALKRGVDILVATPGRLLDLIGQGYVDLRQVEIFVLDEADRMLDMGFIHDVRQVIKKLPEKRQTLLFSATMPKEIRELSNSMLKNPVRVSVTPESSTVEAIDQKVCFVDRSNKRKLLIHLLKDESVVSALVFTRTKHGADRVARELQRAGIKAAAIHGDKTQGARQDALGRFKEGKIRVLVATDIAARGLDISELSHVFNVDLPEVPETYVHRIGRTGRAGLSGTAISFCEYGDMELFRAIEKLIGKEIPELAGHPYPMQVFSSDEPRGRGRGREEARPVQGLRPAPGEKIRKAAAPVAAPGERIKKAGTRDEAAQRPAVKSSLDPLARLIAPAPKDQPPADKADRAQRAASEEPAAKKRRRRRRKPAGETAAAASAPQEPRVPTARPDRGPRFSRQEPSSDFKPYYLTEYQQRKPGKKKVYRSL